MGALYKGRVVARNKGAKLQGEVAELHAISLLEGFPGLGKALAVAGGGLCLTPVEGK